MSFDSNNRFDFNRDSIDSWAHSKTEIFDKNHLNLNETADDSIIDFHDFVAELLHFADQQFISISEKDFLLPHLSPFFSVFKVLLT